MRCANSLFVLSQDSLILPVRRLWQVSQCRSDMCRNLHYRNERASSSIHHLRLHPARSFCEDVDDSDQLFMFCFPPSFYWTRVNDRLDVLLDVLPLSTLQGNVARN